MSNIPLSQIPNAPQRGAGVTQIRAPRQAPRVDTSVPRLQGAQADASKFKVRGQSPGIDDSYIQNENRANQQISRAVAGVGQVLGGIHDEIVRARGSGYLSETELAIDAEISQHELGLNTRTDYENFGTSFQDRIKPVHEQFVKGAPANVRDRVDFLFRKQTQRAVHSFETRGVRGTIQKGAAAKEALAERDLGNGDLESYEKRINEGVAEGFFSPAQGAQMVKSAHGQYAVDAVVRSINLDPWEAVEALDAVDENGGYTNFEDVPKAQRSGLQRAARMEAGRRQSEIYNDLLKDAHRGIFAESETLDGLVDAGRLTIGARLNYESNRSSLTPVKYDPMIFDEIARSIDRYDVSNDPQHEGENAILARINETMPPFYAAKLQDRLTDAADGSYTPSQLSGYADERIKKLKDNGAFGSFAGENEYGETIVDTRKELEAEEKATALRDRLKEAVKDDSTLGKSDVLKLIEDELGGDRAKVGADLLSPDASQSLPSALNDSVQRPDAPALPDLGVEPAIGRELQLNVPTVTGYWPGDKAEAAKHGLSGSMEGGVKDAHGNTIWGNSTYEDYFAGRGPGYITVAMDKDSELQAEYLVSDQHPGAVFRVMDNGGYGNGRTGNSWIDIAYRDPSKAKSGTQHNVSFKVVTPQQAANISSLARGVGVEVEGKSWEEVRERYSQLHPTETPDRMRKALWSLREKWNASRSEKYIAERQATHAVGQSRRQQQKSPKGVALPTGGGATSDLFPQQN